MLSYFQENFSHFSLPMECCMYHFLEAKCMNDTLISTQQNTQIFYKQMKRTIDKKQRRIIENKNREKQKAQK